jgi:hypothetical protein
VLDSIDIVDARGVEASAEGYRILLAREVRGDQARVLKGLIEEQPRASYFDLRSPERVVTAAEPVTELGG